MAGKKSRPDPFSQVAFCQNISHRMLYGAPLARIIREVITNDSQWCKVGYESQ
jgi:hypothetical protein